MTTAFDTTEYEFSHGRKPRGTGTWAFADADDGPDCEPYFIHAASYTEAKTRAARHFRLTHGRRPGFVTRIITLP